MKLLMDLTPRILLNYCEYQVFGPKIQKNKIKYDVKLSSHPLLTGKIFYVKTSQNSYQTDYTGVYQLGCK